MKSYLYHLKSYPMKNALLLMCFLFAGFANTDLSAQCNPDVSPPTALCKGNIVVQLSSNGTIDFWASDVNNNSFDNCPGSLSLRLEKFPISPTPPLTVGVQFNTSDIGINDVAMWAVDVEGNSAFCTTTLEITCDLNTPLTCNNQLNVSLDQNGQASIQPEWILEGGPYCYNEMGIDFLNGGGAPGLPSLDVNNSHIGTQNVVIYDAANGSSCWSTVLIQGFPGGANCSPDVTSPVAICDAFTVVALGVSGTSTIDAVTFDDGSYDNCPGILEYLASNGLPAADSITFDTSDIGINQVVLTIIDQAGNSNSCMIEVEVKSCFFGSLVCTTSQTVTIPPSGQALITPQTILESGPPCNPLGVDFFATGMPPGVDSILLDTTYIGTTQTMVVYDLLTGNSCWGEINIIDCQNDTIPPVAICLNGLVLEMGQAVPSEVTLWASDIDYGSYDNCSGVEFRIELGPTPSASAPATSSLTFNQNEIGSHDVVLWVIDESGNENYCVVTVEIILTDCNNDNTPPICIAPADASISNETFIALGIDPNNPADLDQYFGQPDGEDNCGVLNILKTVEIINGGTTCPIKEIRRNFTVIDSTGNITSCTQIISIYSAWEVHLPADYFPGDPTEDSLSIIKEDGALMALSFDDQLFDYDCDGNADIVFRKWTALNWCDANSTITIVDIPRLDIDNDGHTGDGFNIEQGQDSLYLLENGISTTALASSASGFCYVQILRYNYNDTLDFTVTGTVYHDDNDDCDLNTGESGLAGWPVVLMGTVSGTTYTTTTDSLGQYSFDACTSDTIVEISLDVPFNYGQTCGTTHTVQFTPGQSQNLVQNIPVDYDTLCPILWVDISTPFLRRCFENYYTVNYCNYSDETIEDVYVEVQLDPSMEYTSSDLTGTLLGSNLYSFDIGAVPSGECGSFKIYFDLSCNAILNATHCVNAHIFPDTLCPNPVNWSGANIEVNALCENDTVFLSVKNSGNSAMAGPLEYIVVEDVIMLQEDQFNLLPGETEPIMPIPANGATYRIEAEQEPGHPYPGSVAATVEGCNGINLFGLVNLFTMENPNPFIAIDCQQNIGSFDPNDKQAFPTGYGDEHYIERNTDIDYLIRFQNTGTDTAFTVVVVDELDPSLDPASVRPGASSHDYQFELIDGNTIRFTFNDIMLPDSNVNESASHGFIKFKASQLPNLPLSTVIENDAAIYFDFNDPIITNTVFHTIGDHFIDFINNTGERPDGLGELLTYPNPSAGDVLFEIPTTDVLDGTFVLQDALGKTVRTDKLTNNNYQFKRNALTPGIYFYRINLNGIGTYSGKVILK